MSNQGPSLPGRLVGKPLAQAVLFIFTIIYIIRPVDLISDIIPIIGWLDDVAVLLAQIAAFVLYLRQKRQEFAGKKSERQTEGRQDGR
jgi:uncharacterized membrane protein YkvA (DUF1232 family)